MGMKEDVLAMLEAAVKKLVEDNCDAVVAGAVKALEDAIPGDIDNAILEAAKAKIQEAIKAELLKLVDKISA